MRLSCPSPNQAVFDGRGRSYVSFNSPPLVQGFPFSVAQGAFPEWTRNLGPTSRPLHLAVDCADRLFVANDEETFTQGPYRSSVLNVDSMSGIVLSTIPYSFNRPTGIAFDSMNNLFVLDVLNSKIVRFSCGVVDMSGQQSCKFLSLIWFIRNSIIHSPGWFHGFLCYHGWCGYDTCWISYNQRGHEH
jgi:hypothetical protein